MMLELERIARKLKRGGPGRKLPSLWFVTDPTRTPDPAAIVSRLPKGAGVIYRAFGDPAAPTVAARLRRIARARRLVLLVGANESLAAASGVDGLHLPERSMGEAPMIRSRRPLWLITAAVHDASALARAGRLGLDAALLSAVFPSDSPSAGPPIGPVRLAALARGAALPVIALGGVNAGTARRLIGTGVSGLAAVSGLGSV